MSQCWSVRLKRESVLVCEAEMCVTGLVTFTQESFCIVCFCWGGGSWDNPDCVLGCLLQINLVSVARETGGVLLLLLLLLLPGHMSLFALFIRVFLCSFFFFFGVWEVHLVP